jgi:hypothetical protein
MENRNHGFHNGLPEIETVYHFDASTLPKTQIFTPDTDSVTTLYLLLWHSLSISYTHIRWGTYKDIRYIHTPSLSVYVFIRFLCGTFILYKGVLPAIMTLFPTNNTPLLGRGSINSSSR